MQIIGFNLTKISVQREEKIEGKLEIKQNIGIDDVSEENIPITKDDAIKIKFTFSVDYNEGKFAKVEFKGHIIVLPEKQELKDFLKSWKDKQVPEGIRTPLFNFIMSKCNIKALSLEDEMNLPLHVPMPKLSAQPEENQNTQNNQNTPK
jgi:hypothetical protein